jgi:hypothetical protein
MHIDGEVHGQDDEFTAEFDKLHSDAPSDQDRPSGDEASGDEKAGADQAPADDKPGADAAPAPKANDPWAGASPELLAERDKLQGELERTRHSDQSQRGRVAALQRQISQLSSSEPRQPQDQDQPDKDGGKPDSEAETKAERLKQLREDYPDLAGPILDLIDDAQREIKAVVGRVSPVIEASDVAAVEAQEKALAEKHPDWATIGASQDFAGWASSQPKTIRDLCSSFDAAEVSAALSLFKQERDASKAKEPDPAPGNDPKPQDQQRDDRRDRQLQGARDRPSRAAPTAAGAPDDFEAAFDHFAKRRASQKK